MKVFVILSALLMVLSPFGLYAKQEVRSIATTDHIKFLNYSASDVHVYTGYYGYQCSLVLEEGEQIATFSMGDTGGWQTAVEGNRIFLKPLNELAQTNATLITNKRTYYIEFHADDVTGLDDPRLAYEVRFLYPSVDSSASQSMEGGGLVLADESGDIPDLRDEEVAKNGINFKYSISMNGGASAIAPLKVFDYQGFTYMQFRQGSADLPAVFAVDSQGYESLINFRVVRKDYIVVERIASVFTLRHGSDTVCIFNESMM